MFGYPKDANVNMFPEIDDLLNKQDVWDDIDEHANV